MKSTSSPQQSIQFADFSSDLRCDRALMLRQFEEAFEIIHASYSERGFIIPNCAGKWMNRHHLLAASRVFLATKAKQACGTLTLVEDGPLGVPMETTFRQEVRRCREENGTIAEATCLALATPGTSNGTRVVNHLMGVVAQAARRSGINQILITVHPRHAQYYIRMAGFRKLSPALAYPSVRGHLAMPLALHLPSLKIACPAAYRRYFSMQFSEPTLAVLQTPHATLYQLSMIWRDIQRDTLEYLPNAFSSNNKGIRTAA